jgi:hypothetical protein
MVGRLINTNISPEPALTYPTNCPSRKGAKYVLRAQGWKCHLLDLNLANPLAPGLPEVAHYLHLEAQELGSDHVSRPGIHTGDDQSRLYRMAPSTPCRSWPGARR